MSRFDLGRFAGATFIALLMGLAHAEDAPRAPVQALPQSATAGPVQTLKERLGDKASDEQRVDNCKVPLERRGSKVRPDGCEHERSPR
jgi:hypothetical protein